MIANLGKKPSRLASREAPLPTLSSNQVPMSNPVSQRQTRGCDIFVESRWSAAELGDCMSQLAPQFGLRLKMISNRGTQVYPSRGAETACVDHWRCRHFADSFPSADQLAAYLAALESKGLRWMHIEKLEEIEGKPGFTKAQGED